MAHPLLKRPAMEKLRKTRIMCLAIALLSLAGAAQAGSVTLAWNPNSDGTSGYRIYWGHQSGVYGGSVDVGNVTTWHSMD